MTFSFRETVKSLRVETGVPAGDAQDEHYRFALYREALKNVRLHELLITALASDPDANMSASIFLELLKLCPGAAERQLLLNSAGRSNMPFLQQRSDDLDLLEKLSKEIPDTTSMAALIESSDWCQRRAVETLDHDLVLRALVDDGRTRRIRSIAATKLRKD